MKLRHQTCEGILVGIALAIGAVAVVFASMGAARAWDSVAEMNRVIDHTNFIVEDRCSGTLISKTDRLIVTAYHCVDGEIRILTRKEVGDDGKVQEVKYEKRARVQVKQKNYAGFEQTGELSYVTEIVDYDKPRDLALLQLVGTDLRSEVAAPLIHKDQTLMRGEPVIAVGNPRMLDASVTVGVVSSLTRTFDSLTDRSSGEKVPMIQFDANINPGSSGGALFDGQGRYIGTTTAAVPGSDLSLAVPYFVLYELLDANCYASLYDPEADDAACRAERDAEPDETKAEAE